MSSKGTKPHDESQIRVLVVDDEAPARRRLVRLLREERDILICGTCSNGDEALRAIEEHRPDLVFLDVQLPGRDGFEVVASLPAGAAPAVIFQTGFEAYATRAFEVAALDYLLKPIDAGRLSTALKRFRDRHNSEADAPAGIPDRSVGSQGASGAVGAAGATRAGYAERLLVKAGGKRILLPVEKIDRVVAEGNYLRLHVGSSSHLIRSTMNALEAMLSPSQFLRIHRATIVKIDRIREISPWFNGEYMVVLTDGSELKMSRGYRDQLFKRKAL